MTPEQRIDAALDSVLKASGSALRHYTMPKTLADMREILDNPDCPIDLTGMDEYSRALVMAKRPDCPIDLTGMDEYNRALVMANRLDCPIDLTGMDEYNRALVMTSRLDCPIDLTGYATGENDGTGNCK